MTKTFLCPPPPDINAGLLLRAARWLVSRHAIPADDLEAAAHDIAVVYRAGMDGYGLARALEIEQGWTGLTTEIVNDLDAFPAVVRQELQLARRNWVQEHNIQPPYPDGTHLVQGEILGVYEFMPATYRVRERSGHAHSRELLIPFEDAVPVPAAQQSNPLSNPQLEEEIV